MPKIEPSWIESKVPLEITLHAFTITSGYDIPKLYLSTQPKKHMWTTIELAIMTGTYTSKRVNG